MFRFIHAADLHLDSPFAALPPEQAAARRQELRDLPLRLAEYVRREGIQLVLLAGDLLDSVTPYPETCRRLAEGLEEMAAPVLIAPGNHDYYAPGTPWQSMSWPGNVRIFRTGVMETVDLPELNAAVSGAAFTAPEQRRGLLTGFSAPKDGRVHFGLLHGETEPAQARYNPIRKEEIAASGLDYLALGHIHRRGALRCGETVCAWPGCPQGRGFDELGEKGFCQGTVSEKGMELAFVPFARRRYEILEVDVTGKRILDAVNAALPAHTERDCYRLVLTGETAENSAGLEAALQSRFDTLELRDRTRAPEDLWARAGEDSLRGLFLRNLHERLEAAATEPERETIRQAARFGLAALDRRDLG